MKKYILRIGIIGVLCLIALAIVLTLSLGSIIKKGVETVGPQITSTEMKLEGVNVSFLSGSGSLKGFLLGNPEGYKTPSAIQAGEVSLGVKPGSVLSDKIHVTHIKVIDPVITFEGTLGTKNNLSKILENVEAATGGAATGTNPPAPAGKGASQKLQVDDFLVSGAKVNVSMTMLAGKAYTVTIPDIHFSNLGTGPDGITAAELTQRILKEVTALTLKAVEKNMGDITKGATDVLSKEATNALDKATKSVGDLFKKK
jgi:uncharacterized protein involved in outer membrane biogenesis